MAIFARFLALLLIATTVSLPALADDARMSERVLGKANAPVKVDEFVSLTCTHCSDFYNNTLPELERRYVDTGKVKFIMHDFPIDGASLKAATLARCMPADEFYPFIKILYKNLMSWAYGSGNPETNLIQYAKLGGLSEDKAKACLNDTALQDTIVTERTKAGDKYKIEATPTFIINDGAQTIKGSQSVETFAAAFDQILNAKK